MIFKKKSLYSSIFCACGVFLLAAPSLAQIIPPPIHEEKGVFSISSPPRRMEISKTTPLTEAQLFQPRDSKKKTSPFFKPTNPRAQKATNMVGPYTFNGTGFVSAILAEDIEKVSQFLEKGIDVNIRNNLDQSALSAAVNTGNVTLIEMLLKAGANPNSPSKRQQPPPLLRAVASNNIAVARLLLNYQANINVVDENGWSPLFHTIENNNVLMMLNLIKLGANVNQVDNFSSTPLLTAIQKNNAEITYILLQNGANINVRDFSGATPLLTAVLGQRYKIVQILLESGANAREMAPNGTPVLHIALEKNYTAIANLLLAHGALPPSSNFAR